MSQLETRIELALAHETDEQRRAELVAKRAIYWARVGRYAEARESIRSVRATFSDGRSGRVTCLLMLAEGILLYFDGLNLRDAMDRVTRSQLLGTAMRDREIASLASAWRAYLEFEDSRFESCARSIAHALESGADVPLSAASRVAVVMLNVCSMMGARELAQFWFKRGHASAVEEGDQATIDALLHSKVAFAVAYEFAQLPFGTRDIAATSLMRGEVASARSLQHLAGIGAHAGYIDLVDAHLCIVEREFSKALSLLDKVTAGPGIPAGHLNVAALNVERAFCAWSTGSDPSDHLANLRWDGSDLERLDVDDRLVHSWMLSELLGAKGDTGQVDLARAQLEVAKADYVVLLEELKRSFGRLAAP